MWAELIASEQKRNEQRPVKPQEPEIAVIYRRRKPQTNTQQNVARRDSSTSSEVENRLSLAPPNRISWNRSLSTRGRTSIAVTACVKPQRRKPGRKAKPPLPRGKAVELPNFDKEKAYFEEVDAFDLMEESPSPKKSGTWTMAIQTDHVAIPRLTSILQKWLLSKKLNNSYAPPISLSKILETPASRRESAPYEVSRYSILKASENASIQLQLGLCFNEKRCLDFTNEDISKRKESSERSIAEVHTVVEDDGGDIEVQVGKLSLTSRPSSLDAHSWDPFLALLAACGQSHPFTLLDVISKSCNPTDIVKIGEGTYGEAFKVGENVCKIVPFDGDLRVNGEIQKKAEELLEEVVLSGTLNSLRGYENDMLNCCTSFIQTIDMRVCQGPYDASLIRAWEDWEVNQGTLNDNPREFPEKQCYIIFVQEHGGKDLESFVLLNYDEARSLLVQATLALAVAEAAYEFEHRDLHWGNILLTRKASPTVQFILEGRQIHVRTFGLLISIIDFTLSRMNTGEDVLYLDLSSDPELFEGPKGDKQSETYRKMREVTGEFWEESFPKTNVLWLQYLVDILLLKKAYARSTKDERELRSLKKRLNSYGSAKEAASDPFFSDLYAQ
nr:serine/threonine-protein kinase haspin homolog [Ipomoea batatas]